MAEFHKHPMNPDQLVFGERLNVGDVIQPNDVYDSTTGKWEKTPLSGVPVRQGVTTYFVRPKAE